MTFLLDKCIFSPLDNKVVQSCQSFCCGHDDLNDFFKNDSHDYSRQLLGKSYCFLLEEDPTVIVCAFTISNDSIKVNNLPGSRKRKVAENIPQQKHFRSYPAVLIGRLGVNKDFKKRHIGIELMDFIKSWFVDANNKTGCRFIVVDSYNEDAPLSYYKKNSFECLFSTEKQEREYMELERKKNSDTEQIAETSTKLKTRLMYFDLILLDSEAENTETSNDN